MLLSRFDLRTSQDTAIEFIKANQSCALFIPVGYGKTVSALTAFVDMKAAGQAQHALVVAPLRVARDVWMDEIRQWLHLHGLTAARIIGSEKERLAGLNTKADIHLVNRENTSWLEQQFLAQVSEYRYKQIARWPWDIVFLDESQSFKSQTSRRWRSMKRIRQFFKPRIVELTGSPATNGYADLWGQMFLIDGGKRLGRSESAYQQRWFDPPPVGGYNWTLKPYAAEQIQDALRDVVFSQPDDMELPPVVYNPIRVHLPPTALRAYRAFQRTAVLELNGHTITGINAGALHQKLLQAANGALYVEGGGYEIFHEAKTAALLEMLETLSEPIVVGYGFKHDLARIQEVMRRYYGKKKLWGILNTAESLKSFAGGLWSAGIMHPKSGGHGLNDLYLSGAENLVWFGLTNDLELWDQLNGRLAGGHRRVGRNVVINAIVAVDTHDEDMLDLLARKDRSQVDLARALVRSER